MVNGSVESQPLEQLAEVFKLMADGTRLRILWLLSKGERNVSSLCGELNLPQPTVSHHLGLLRARNLIVNRRNGKQVIYGLDGHVSMGPGPAMLIRSGGYAVRITGAAF